MKHQKLKYGVLSVLLGFVIICKGCPIKNITGISCAGCGMTRAWLCALRLDVTGAFMYHPLFWTVPLILILILKKEKIQNIIYKCCIVLFLTVYVVVYLKRLLDPADRIVTIAFSEGFIGRIINFLGENII